MSSEKAGMIMGYYIAKPILRLMATLRATRMTITAIAELVVAWIIAIMLCPPVSAFMFIRGHSMESIIEEHLGLGLRRLGECTSSLPALVKGLYADMYNAVDVALDETLAEINDMS